MNLKTTYFLFAAVVVVLVVFVLVLMFGSRGDAEDYLFADLHPKAAKAEDLAKTKDQVARLEIERLKPSAEPLVFEKEGTIWALTKPYHAKIDSSLIDRAVGSLVDARLEKKAPTANFSQTGLDSPSAAIDLHVGDKVDRVLLGNLTLGSGGNIFVARANDPKKPLAIRRSVLDELFRKDSETADSAGEALKSISDFRPRSFLADGSPIAWQTVQTITLQEGNKVVELKKDAKGNWQFVKPDNYGFADSEGVPAGPAQDNIVGVKPLLTRLTGLSMPTDANDILEGVSDFAKYGVESDKASMRIEFTRESGAKEALLIGNKADEKGDKVYARLDGERCVVKLPAKSLEPIRKLIASPKEMRDRTLTHVPAGSIDAIDIKLGSNNPIELRKAGTPAQWRVFEGEAHENANAAAVQQLINEITQPRNIRDFPDSAANDKALGLDPPAVEVSIWQNGVVADKSADAKLGFFAKLIESAKITKPKLKGDPALRLKFGKKEKDFVYVRRVEGIVSNLVTLPDAVLASASRPATDYLDLTLPSFTYANVIKLSFNRGPAKYEVEKEKADPSAKDWKILQPSDMAGRTADAGKVAQILGNLQTAYANKIVARKATDAELEKFGLKPAKIEAIVTIKDEKEPKVYQFGNETPDKLQYYMKVTGSDHIFTVNKDRFTAMVNDEIADPTIWRLDPNKIREIKFKGWSKLGKGKLLTLDLIRKSATDWSAKDQAGYAVDAAKAEAFAASLGLVRADHFIKGKGGPDPGQALDPQADALEIQVVVEGENEPFTLTIGAEDKRNNTAYYFATSNRVPGAVFLVFKDRFAELRTKGREYFQKPK